MDPEKFSNNAKMGEFDYLRLLKRQKVRGERGKKHFGKFNVPLLDRDKQSTNGALI